MELDKLQLIIEPNEDIIKIRAKDCEVKHHLCTVTYTTKYDALTHICFSCKAVHTNIMEIEELM